MKIFGLIAAFIILALIDLPVIIKKDKGSKLKYFVVCSIILIIGFIISLLQITGNRPPSPSLFIQIIIKGIMGEI